MSAQHVYVHVPFCARRCVYCDFSIAVRQRTPVSEYVARLQREVEIRFPDELPRDVRSLYLGGGTPSRLGGQGVSDVLAVLQRRWRPTPDAEITIEANPEDVTPDAARVWRAAGVNRVSLGVQSFSPRVLEWMHRTHDVAAVHRAVEAIRSAGIAQLSLDLIFGLPPDLGRVWTDDLRQAVALGADHVSAYGLTVEHATPLARTQARGQFTEIDDALYAEEFLQADALLTAAGLAHYEVSNYARAGATALHNSAYWSRVPYIGLGPSAHEFLDGTRRWNVAAYSEWERRLGEGSDPIAGSERPQGESEALERLFLDLRTTRGALWDSRDAEIVESWVRSGWANVREDRVVLTPLGWLRMNALVSALTSRRSRY